MRKLADGALGAFEFSQSQIVDSLESALETFRDTFGLFGRGASEYPVDHGHARAQLTRMTDTDAQAPEVTRCKALRDVLEAVVTGVAAAELQAHCPRREIKFVVNYQNFFRRNFVVGGQRLYGLPR